MPKKYCGKKEVPPGREQGSPNECFRSGFAVGIRAASSTGEKKIKKARVAGEAAATARLRKKIPKPSSNQEIEDRLKAMRERVAKITEEGLAKIRAPPRRIQRAETGTQTGSGMRRIGGALLITG